MKQATLIAASAVVALSAASMATASTLDDVKGKGFIQCGVNGWLPGFSTTDDKGNWAGLDVDYCRARATATLGDPKKVKFTLLTAKDRFTALQSGEIDVLARNTTWTLSRDAGLGIDFIGVLYYDGQGFMVRKKLGVKSVKDLDGAAVCVNSGTTTELNLADYFRSNNMKYKRSEEHTSELQSLLRISYAVFCLTKKTNKHERKDILLDNKT